MIILYIIKLVIFNYLCSLFFGLILIIPSSILLLFDNKDGSQSLFSLIISAMTVLVLIGIQSLSISKATEYCLLADPSRISILWYLLAFFCCPPIALQKKS